MKTTTSIGNVKTRKQMLARKHKLEVCERGVNGNMRKITREAMCV
jgi:hypothetical protein